MSVISFGDGRAEGKIYITYPSGSTTSPFSDTFVTQRETTSARGHGEAVSVIVLKAPGTIDSQAKWTGTPSTLAMIINGPGQVGYYARRDASSPFSVSYNVTAADLAYGDLWRVTLVGFCECDIDINGTIEIAYP